ncbi:glycoside hydrolase family 15 protein [Georgenia yuyongxinii]|uniref:Glycoside hydrolase family 15 protein n=1 Tax=Georgenia yuyongxinii TaxID=2589797 RepID=A0A552WML6_9MICO|nr:glycoside hydrolase family 15 protein [Georgenia yuyongxinii]TRW44028.1 glycoside hydrolase family 15 protein [Georgenia yuyongxinii]
MRSHDVATTGEAATTPIEEYAVLGDARSVAVVSRRGSIDWLCLPWLDSEACFAALLGTSENGRWLLTAVSADDGEVRVDRRYLGDSWVLETTYTTPTGQARVIEAMPLRDERSDIIRRIEGVSGTVTFVHEFVVRFGYGKTRPWVHREKDPDGRTVIRAVAGPDALTMHGDRLPRADNGRHLDYFDITAGDVQDLVLTWNHSWEPVPRLPDVDHELVRTEQIWAGWARTSTYDGEFDEQVRRSLLVLRLLTQDPTGGIAAAATTSLPEEIGGERNWDYRFSWLRDAALTLEALLELGFRGEGETWRQWLLRAAAGEPEHLQIMYRLDGARELPERELAHLPGYAGSRPVRVGNAAVDQHQNDVLGEVMLALDLARRAGLRADDDGWALQRHLVDSLLARWTEPDHGIWEIRGPLRHFTHSKVMCWAALDCAVRAVEDYGCTGPVEKWRAARAQVHADVLAHGWDDELRSFVQYYGAKHTDASLLQMVQVGFLPPDDPRLHGTIARIRQELADGPWVRRYLTSTGVDGLAGDEHPFLACCFWLVDALARTGDVATAHHHMEQLCAVINDVGLLAEEYDPVGHRFTGNFPQAFSHLTLVRAAHALDAARAAAAPVGAEAPTDEVAPSERGTRTREDVAAPGGAEKEPARP